MRRNLNKEIWEKALAPSKKILAEKRQELYRKKLEKQRTIDEFKYEIQVLKDENRNLKKMLKALLTPIVRNDTGDDASTVFNEAVDIDELSHILNTTGDDLDFESIDARFNKVYKETQLTELQPNVDIPLPQSNAQLLASPYDEAVDEVKLSALLSTKKIIPTYKPFKRDVEAFPNYLEKEMLRKKTWKEKREKNLMVSTTQQQKQQKLLLLELE